MNADATHVDQHALARATAAKEQILAALEQHGAIHNRDVRELLPDLTPAEVDAAVDELKRRIPTDDWRQSRPGIIRAAPLHDSPHNASGRGPCSFSWIRLTTATPPNLRSE